ncbi:MAG: preprotein translocase subunit YajC [Bacteroidaceae bacterium]|nr:preprotein translocase subunit YajC [Bacteroidaceae bacterium]
MGIFLQTVAGVDAPWYVSLLNNPLTMIILAFAIMYFFMIRPQRKRQKEIENFRRGLQAGQDVVTSGGLYGKIKSVDDSTVSIEIAHNVVIRVDKAAVYADPTAAQQDVK